MASLEAKPADQNQNCFQKKINPGAAGQGLSNVCTCTK